MKEIICNLQVDAKKSVSVLIKGKNLFGKPNKYTPPCTNFATKYIQIGYQMRKHDTVGRGNTSVQYFDL
jgi:hypothetical protein